MYRTTCQECETSRRLHSEALHKLIEVKGKYDRLYASYYVRVFSIVLMTLVGVYALFGAIDFMRASRGLQPLGCQAEPK